MRRVIESDTDESSDSYDDACGAEEQCIDLCSSEEAEAEEVISRGSQSESRGSQSESRVPPSSSANPESGKRKRVGRPSAKASGKRVSSGNLRRWLLVTLSHTETRSVELSVACERLQKTFEISRGVAVKEKHKDLGEHFHIAIECSDASRYTATNEVRKLFPEFEGRGCNVSFHKAWVTMLQYVTKENGALQSAHIFGDYTIDDAERELQAKRGKTMNAVVAVRKHVESGGTCASLAYNDDVAPFMLRSCSSVVAFAGLVGDSQKKENTWETITRLAALGDAAAGLEFIGPEQVEALTVFVKQLHGRRHREPQLYCVGDSGTGKSYLFQLLSMETRCFIPCVENGDRAFAGYSDELHDWIFINDFHDNVKFQLLSNLCEGAPYMLNGYGGQRKKMRNVPIVFTANNKPVYRGLSEQRQKAIQSRMKFVEFRSDYMTSEKEVKVADLCCVLKNLKTLI